MAVLWLDEISAGDLETVGGKGASLGELTGAGLPVPPGFVVTAGTYRSFIEEAEIDEELFAAVDVDVDDSAALADAADRAQELILETPFPDELQTEILESYHEVGNGEAFVAVRSSATAEDLPDASSAGQQETFLNVTEEALLDRVRECWASLFTQRAIYYRQEQGFDHSAVNIAVVIQQMVDAEKSGVMFTSHPSTGDATMIIEAAWGLGEAVVSGAVSPDNYVIDRDDRSMDVTIAEKKVMHEKDEATGQTIEREVPEDKRTQRVVSDNEIDALMDLGERVEDHYGEPQDVEWAIVDGDVYMLQSRPITTIDEDGSDVADPTGSVDAAKGLTDGSGACRPPRAAVLTGPTRVAPATCSSTGSARVRGRSAVPRGSSSSSTTSTRSARATSSSPR